MFSRTLSELFLFMTFGPRAETLTVKIGFSSKGEPEPFEPTVRRKKLKNTLAHLIDMRRILSALALDPEEEENNAYSFTVPAHYEETIVDLFRMDECSRDICAERIRREIASRGFFRLSDEPEARYIAIIADPPIVARASFFGKLTVVVHDVFSGEVVSSEFAEICCPDRTTIAASQITNFRVCPYGMSWVFEYTDATNVKWIVTCSPQASDSGARMPAASEPERPRMPTTSDLGVRMSTTSDPERARMSTGEREFHVRVIRLELASFVLCWSEPWVKPQSEYSSGGEYSRVYVRDRSPFTLSVGDRDHGEVLSLELKSDVRIYK